jgi:adenylate kinase
VASSCLIKSSLVLSPSGLTSRIAQRERGRRIDLVIELKVKDEILIARVEQRNRDGGPSRADDTPDTLRHRLGIYYNSTAPLLSYYERQGKLESVDGMAPIPEVTAAIASLIEHKAASYA